MTYAAIMTHVQSDADATQRLACAIDVANRFGAKLIGVGAEMIPPLAFDAGGFYSLEADWTNAMREEIDKRLKSAHQGFKAATAGVSAGSSWRCEIQLPTPALAAASRAADLIIAGGAARPYDAYCSCSPAELAITSGRPVLVAPSAAPPLAAEQILLAWKDTREARRALSDAMPFLERADRVVVTSVCPHLDAEQSKVAVDDVVGALRRRGITSEGRVVEVAHPTGFHLLEQAGREGADLIVCGAYGHSRLGEWVFGGMTADLLSEDRCYLLLSH